MTERAHSSLAEHEMTYLLQDISTDERGINLETLARVILLAVELAREGREGHKVGTLFVVSDSERVLQRSKPVILDPLWHHPDEAKHVADSDARERIKELSQLDGAFIVTDDGVFRSAGRYINASSEGIDLPLGLGSRYMAAASISKETIAVAIVSSESSVVRIFDNGEILAEIMPELWLVLRHGLHIGGPHSLRKRGETTVVSMEPDGEDRTRAHGLQGGRE